MYLSRGYEYFLGIILLLFATFVLCVGATHGQATAISNRDLITIYWDSPDNPSETLSPAQMDFENSIIETLSNIGIKPYYGVEPDFDIEIGLYGEPFSNISVDPRVIRDHLPQSNILLAHPQFALMLQTFSYEIPFSIQPQNTSALEAARNFLVGISLYSIDRCDLAAQFFAEAQNHADLLTQWHYPTQNDETALIAFYRGNCAIALNQYADAARFFEQSFKGEGNQIYLDPTINLAWTYLQLNRSNDAFLLMDKLVDSQKTDDLRALALEYRARFYALVFRYTDAIADMSAAIALTPDQSYLLLERSSFYNLNRQSELALKDIITVLDLNPTYADAYYARAMFYNYYPAGDDTLRLALIDFKRYLELAPNGEHADETKRYVATLEEQISTNPY